MNEFKQVALELIELVGGLDNIASATHCTTRLRLELDDVSKIDEEGIKKAKMVKGLTKGAGQYQIILGTGIVNKVYKEVAAIFAEAGKENKKGKNAGNAIQQISRLFGDIFIPIIPALILSGILMGLRSFFQSLGMLDAGTPWYNVLAVLIDTSFAFLPALVAWSAAKKFGGNPIYGILIGLMVISSFLPAGPAIGKGLTEPLMVPFGFFELPVKAYQGSVLVAVLGGFLVAKVEWIVRKFVPNVVDVIFTPILTLTISFFAIIFVFGPLVYLIEQGIVALVVMLLKLPLGIGGFITAAIMQVLVISGMHHNLWVVDINMLETGLNFFQPIRNAGIMGQVGACLAFAVFAKEKMQKTNSSAATVSALFGISEPAIFGTTLKFGMPFIFGCIGGGFAGMYASIVNLGAPGMGASCVPGMLYFLGDSTALMHYVISSLIAIAVPFVLTALYVRKRKI